MTHEIPQEVILEGVETPIFDASTDLLSSPATKGNKMGKAGIIVLAGTMATSSVAACNSSENGNQTPDVNKTPIVEETNNPSFGIPLPSEGPIIVETPPASDPLESGEPNTGNVSPEPTEEIIAVNPYGENRTEIFKKIKTQDKEDIEDTSLAEVKKAAYKLLDPKYAEIVASYKVAKNDNYTKDLLDSIFGDMNGKGESFKNFAEGYSSEEAALDDWQIYGMGSFIPMALAVCRESTDPEIQKLAYKLADKAWEYGIDISKNARTKLNEIVQDQINFNPDW